jgi:hypothetical protein
MELICAMWHPRACGVLNMSLSAYGRLIGSSDERTAQMIDELRQSGVAEIKWSKDKKSAEIRCRRIQRDWAEATKHHVERRESGLKGAKQRWLSHSSANSSANGYSVAYQKPEAIKDICTTREGVVAEGKRQGIPEDVCISFYDQKESVGWVDRNGNPIHSMAHSLSGYWRTWQNNQLEKIAKLHKPKRTEAERDRENTGLEYTTPMKILSV